MTRKSLLTILIFFLAGASFWFFSLKKDIKETKELITEQLPAPARIVTREVTRTTASTTDSSDKKGQLQSELQNLQQKLVEEQQRLTTKNETLESLRSRKDQEQPVNYTSQIQERSDQIDVLVSGLRDYRLAENDLSRRAAAALSEQSSAVSLAKDQLDENIRQQEALIRQTQDDLAYWNLNYNYTTEREAHLDELNPLLEAQQQRLQDMRAQRLEISSNVLLQTQSTQADVQDASGVYSQAQVDMSDEIGTLRSEINRLKDEQTRNRMSLSNLNSQISQAQKDYRSQAQQVEDLQNQIRLKQEELTRVE